MALSKCSSIPPLIIDGNLLSDGTAKSEALNTFFASQCNLSVPEYSNKFLAEQRNVAAAPNNEPIFIDAVTTSEDEIKTILSKLDVNKARGSDLIGNRILKECSDALSLPLSILFNNSLDNAIFPTDWKKADVCPVFKKDNPQLISNYRPISLLSPTSKVLERIVYNRLYDYCLANNLLTPKTRDSKKRICHQSVDSLNCQNL